MLRIRIAISTFCPLNTLNVEYQEPQQQCSDYQDLGAGGGPGLAGEAAQERHQGDPQGGASCHLRDHGHQEHRGQEES